MILGFTEPGHDLGLLPRSSTSSKIAPLRLLRIRIGFPLLFYKLNIYLRNMRTIECGKKEKEGGNPLLVYASLFYINNSICFLQMRYLIIYFILFALCVQEF